MITLSIDADAGRIIADNTALPGIVDQFAIKGALVIDSKSKEGESGSTKTLNGWNDADITITLLILGDETTTAEVASRPIIDLFQTAGTEGNAQPLQLLHPQIDVWNIGPVYFAELSTTRSRTSDKITANLSFVEVDTTGRLRPDIPDPEPPEPPSSGEIEPDTQSEERLAKYTGSLEAAQRRTRFVGSREAAEQGGTG